MDGKTKILVVDDDPKIRFGVTRLLKANGHDITEAGTGEEAIEAVKADHPDLVLLDVVLPDIDGIEVCRRLKSFRDDIFVVLMSGKRIESDQQAQGLEGGADGYIARPIANRELTARVEAMLRIKRTEKQLRKSEEKFRSIIENAGLGIIVIAPNSVILDANPAFCEMAAFEKSELVGKSYPYPFFPDEGIEELKKDLAYIMIGNTLNRETVIIKKDGSQFPVSITASPVLDDKHEAVSYIFFVQDITEKRRAEAAMMKTRKLEAIGVMIGGVAHDLNNLLTVIWGNIDLSQMDVEPGSEIAETLAVAREACIMTRDLVRQYSRVAGISETHFQKGDIARVVTETARLESAGNQVKYRFFFAENLWPVHFDHEKIKMAFREVLQNAVEAVSGKGILEIKVGNTAVPEQDSEPMLVSGKYVKISVIDKGVGIAQNNLEKIFDPYFSTKERGNVKGMGLGLSLAQSIFQNHFGTIAAKSEPNKGTTINMYLPADQNESADPK